MPDFSYYPCYPKDLNSDHKVVVMDNRTYGVYRRLLDIAWHEEPAATLPTDDMTLAAYAKESLEGWREIAPVILNCFVKRGNRYWQKRLRREWEKINDTKTKQSEAGKLVQLARSPDRYAGRSPDSSPPLRAYGYGSGSPPEADYEVKDGKLLAARLRLCLEVYGLNPEAPLNSPLVQAVRSHLAELEQLGIKQTDFEFVLRWLKWDGAQYKPRDPLSLTDPLKWAKWLTTAREQDKQKRTRKPF